MSKTNIKRINISFIAFIILGILALGLVLAPKSAGAQGIYYYSLSQGANTTTTNYNPSPTYTYATNSYNLYQAPAVYSVTPSSLRVNQAVGPITLAINGNNFYPASVARWNNMDRVTSYVNPNYLVMQLYPADLAAPGNNQVSVFNWNGGTSNSVNFSVTSAGGTTASTASNSTATSTASTAAKTATDDETEQATQEVNEKLSTLAASAIVGGDTFMPSGIIQWLIIAIIILLAIILVRKIVRSRYERAPMKHA